MQGVFAQQLLLGDEKVTRAKVLIQTGVVLNADFEEQPGLMSKCMKLLNVRALVVIDPRPLYACAHSRRTTKQKGHKYEELWVFYKTPTLFYLL